MYIEKNGFVIVQKETLRFLAEDNDWTDDIEYALILNSNDIAINVIKEFSVPSEYEICRYSKTIWIDQDDVEQYHELASMRTVVMDEPYIPYDCCCNCQHEEGETDGQN